MKSILPDLPRSVLLSLAVILSALVLFGVLIPTLGGARDVEVERNAGLNGQISSAESALRQSAEDREFIIENQARFEDLLESDRLVPHTRRVAIAELQRVAVARGLTSLNYRFQAAGDASPATAGSQPTSDAYRVSVERVELNIGAPFDGPIYRFIDDITLSFPGSAVVQSFSLSRLRQVTDQSLQDVSDGRHSRLVEGTLLFLWRTAQSAADDDEESGR